MRKQSVEDAERMISPRVADFMESKGPSETARYFRIFSDYHVANDGHSRTQEWRSTANKATLYYLLDDYMPWRKDGHDLSMIDINKYETFLSQIDTI